MNMQHLWQLAGWTMIHFLWIGAALAAIAALLRVPLRRAAPNLRYSVTLACFVAISAAPIVIAAWLWAPAVIEPVAPPALAPAREPAFAKPPTPAGLRQAEATVIDLAETPILIDTASEPLPQFNPAPLAPAQAEVPAPAPPSYRALLDHTSQWLPWVWIVGTPLTFLLLASGLIGVERLRRSSKPLISGPVYEAFERLRTALRLSNRVAIAVSDKVVQPVLVGIVRPLILLPPAAVSGWTPAQLEMALVHELAHVRRWDNLVNLFQRLVESLLFFHPGVWLVSRWLRADREQCCDAIVVRHTDSPEAYAELLLNVASLTLNRRLPSMAAPQCYSPLARHPLARRVRRLLQLEDDPMLVSRSTLGLVGLAAAAIVCTVLWQPAADTVAQESAAELKMETTENTEDTKKTASRVVPDPEETDPGKTDPNSPFLPLEQQRIADLAYGMLHLEIEPLDKDIVPQLKKHRFSGGVEIVKVAGMDIGFQAGDILVGLHVWPTVGFDGLAEVLRRDDLMEFSPLKYYVLRPVPVESGREGGFGKMMGSGGGEFGGRRGEMGGGRGFGGRGEAPNDAKPKTITKLKLVTGRVTFDPAAWQAEQMRLQRAEDDKEAKKPSGPNFRNIGTDPETGHEIGVPMESTQTPAPDRAKLLYDGRTFDQWRTQWKTELKVEKRTEAIKALAAFGRAGQGEQAAEAILDVVLEYDLTRTNGDAPLTAMRGAFFASLVTGPRHLDANVWLPRLLDRIDNSDDATQQENAIRLMRFLMGYSRQVVDSELSKLLLDLPEERKAELNRLFKIHAP